MVVVNITRYYIHRKGTSAWVFIKKKKKKKQQQQQQNPFYVVSVLVYCSSFGTKIFIEILVFLKLEYIDKLGTDRNMRLLPLIDSCNWMIISRSQARHAASLIIMHGFW